MVFSANELWWQPHKKVYEALAGSGPSSAKLLDKHTPWLLHTLARFKPQSSTSATALKNESHFEADGKKAVVEAKLRGLVGQVSSHLGLDEVQSFFLFKRWLREDGLDKAPAELDAQAVLRITEYYFSERIYLLKALGEVLSQADRQELAPLAKRLVDQGLEGNLFALLSASFPTFTLGEEAATGGMLAVAPPGKGRRLEQEQRLWALQAATERCLVLDLLIMLYSQTPQLCSAARWKALALLLRDFLGNARMERDPEVAAFQNRARQLATLLMLQGLDLEGLMDQLAAGQEAHHLTGDADLQEVEAGAEALMTAKAPSPVVLMGWAAFQVLHGSETEAETSPDALANARNFGAWSWNNGFLGSLYTMLQGDVVGSDHALSGLYRSVILHLLSATVAAFSVSPHSLAAAELEAFVAVVAALMDGQPELCDAFWEAASPEELEDERGAASGALLMPLVSFLDATRGLFPAAPLPLLSLLSGLAQGAPAAVHAYIYLKELPGLTVLHDGAAVFASVGREDGSGELVTTRQPLALPGDFFTLPQGVQGSILPLPPALAPGSSLLGPEASGSSGQRLLVRWEGSCPGQMLLVLLAQQALRCLSEPASRPDDAAAAGRLLHAALRLLAQLLESEPSVVHDCLAWSWSEPAEGAKAGMVAPRPDALLLLGAAVRAVSHSQQPLAEDVGNCFRIAAALARHLPVQVVDTLAASPLFARPDSLMNSEIVVEVSALSFFRQHSEAPAGKYPATLGFVKLLEALISSGMQQAPLLDWFSHAVHAVLAPHRSWQYSQQAERWRLAAACVRLVRCALQTSHTSEHGKQLHSLVARIFSQEGAFRNFLLYATPPGATALQSMSLTGLNMEAIPAAEGAVEELLLLLPPLLEAVDEGDGSSVLGRELFQVPAGTNYPMPVTLISSYLGYAPVSAELTLACVRAVHALGKCSANLTGHISFASSLHQGKATGTAITRDALIAAFDLPTARAQPELYCAVADVVQVTVGSHPSMLDLLMFPSDMVPSATGKAAKEDSAKPPPPQHSCLDGLWAVLREAGQLYEQQPRPVAAALSVLCALWQNSDRANRIVDALRTQPGFWKAIAACVPDTDATAQSDSDWEEGDSDALLTWKLLAQSKALEVITLELHANPESMASDAAEGTWQALAQWRSGRDRASAVVEHCCQMCPRIDLLAHTRRAARAAAVELLAHVYSLPTGSCWTGPPLLERLRLENMWMEGLLFNGAVTPDSLFQLSSDMLSREPEGGFPAQRQRLLNESHSWPDSLEELLLTAAAVPRRSANAADAEAEALIHADASGGWWGPNPSTDGATAAALAATAFNVAALEAALGPGLVRAFPSLQGLLEGMLRAEAAITRGTAALFTLRSVRALATVSCRGPLKTTPAERGAAAAPGAAIPLISGRDVEAYTSRLQDCLGALLALSESGAPGSPGAGNAAVADAGGRWQAEGGGERWGAEPLLCEFTAEVAEMLLLSLKMRSCTSEGSAKEASALNACSEVAHMLASWLRCWLHRRPYQRLAPRSPEHRLTESLLGCTLLMLQLCPAKAAGQLEAQLQVQSAARALLPPLVALSRLWPALTAASTAVVETLLWNVLPSHEWLSLAQHIAPELLAPLLRRSWPRPGGEPDATADGSAADDKGACIQLALGLAQSQAGATLLHDQGVMQACVWSASWLLGSEGGALGTADDPKAAPHLGPPAHHPALLPSGMQVDSSAEVLKAYSQGREAPLHTHWLALLGLQSALLRHLAPLPSPDVESAAVAFLVTAEPRLLPALMPPLGSPAQPLTLLGLKETSSVAFLLCQMSPLLGPWQMAIQHSPSSFRRAAVSFLEFACLGADAMPAVVVAPQSPAERALLLQSSTLPADAGWMQVVSRSCAAPSGGGRDPAASPSQGGAALVCSTDAPAANGYAAAVASAMYAAVQHCLAFLVEVSPQVSPEDADSLGPEWPKLGLLAELGAHLVGVARAVLEALEDAAEPSRELAQLGRALQRSLRACLHLQSLQGVDSGPDCEEALDLAAQLKSACRRE